jgi:hypothetical protein
MNASRLELARGIVSNAFEARDNETVTHESPSSCPFLNAVPAEPRAELEREFSDPHALPESQLLEIAARHGFEARGDELVASPEIERR